MAIVLKFNFTLCCPPHNPRTAEQARELLARIHEAGQRVAANYLTIIMGQYDMLVYDPTLTGGTKARKNFIANVQNLLGNLGTAGGEPVQANMVILSSVPSTIVGQTLSQVVGCTGFENEKLKSWNDCLKAKARPSLHVFGQPLFSGELKGKLSVVLPPPDVSRFFEVLINLNPFKHGDPPGSFNAAKFESMVTRIPGVRSLKRLPPPPKAPAILKYLVEIQGDLAQGAGREIRNAALNVFREAGNPPGAIEFSVRINEVTRLGDSTQITRPPTSPTSQDMSTNGSEAENGNGSDMNADDKLPLPSQLCIDSVCIPTWATVVGLILLALVLRR